MAHDQDAAAGTEIGDLIGAVTLVERETVGTIAAGQGGLIPDAKAAKALPPGSKLKL